MMNKLKIRHFGKHVQALKSGISNVLTLGACDNSHIQSGSQKKEIELFAWIKFDEVDFDGVHVLVSAMRGGQKTSISNPTAKLFYVDQGSSWGLTPITEKALTFNGNDWVVSYLANELPTILADRTLYVEIRANRLGKRLFFNGYFNHLGALDFMTRNKKKISFLEITKADE